MTSSSYQSSTTIDSAFVSEVNRREIERLYFKYQRLKQKESNPEKHTYLDLLFGMESFKFGFLAGSRPASTTGRKKGWRY